MHTLTPLHRLLLGFCALFLLLIVMEIWWLDFGQEMNKQMEMGKGPEELAEYVWAESPGLDAAHYPEISTRPLFTEGRKPVSVVLGSTEAGTDEEAPEELVLRLAGVGLSDSESLVLVIDNAGEYHRLLLGDTLEGWKLASIESTNATFKQDDRKKIIELEKNPPPSVGGHHPPQATSKQSERKPLPQDIAGTQKQGSKL